MNKLKLARFLLSLLRVLPKRYPLRSSVQPPFFILSAGRSGSTLLNRMLNEHPQLGLPSEQYFMGPAIFKYHFYNFMLWRDLMQVIVGELWDTRKHTWDLEVGRTIQSIMAWTGQERSLDRVMDHLFREVVSKDIWGDSTPLNVVYYKELYQLFPQARYIFLMRDGRDVVASYKAGGEQAFGALASVKAASERWVLAMDALHGLKRRTSVLEIRYEELVSNPQLNLDRICSHLGVPALKGWESYTQHVPETAFYQPSHHHAIREMPFDESIGKWRQVLTEEEQAYSEQVMRRHLERYGYLSPR